MQTGNILLALGGDSGNTVPKFGVTPAEVAVLRVIHGDDAVTEIEPLDKPALNEDEKPRTHRQEIARLTQTYGRLQPNGQRVAPAVSALFPGAAARVFETFDELELPEDLFKAEPRRKPARRADPLDHDADGKKGGTAASTDQGLKGLTVQQLREYASVNQIDIGEASKKADIIAAIEAAEADKQQAGGENDASEEDEDGVGDIDDDVGEDENLFK